MPVTTDWVTEALEAAEEKYRWYIRIKITITITGFLFCSFVILSIFCGFWSSKILHYFPVSVFCRLWDCVDCQVQTQILIKFHLQNQLLNQTSASPINLKFKILTKPSFRISTKIQLHNLYKTSAAKCWANSSFKILPEFQLQNLDQPLGKLSFTF